MSIQIELEETNCPGCSSPEARVVIAAVHDYEYRTVSNTFQYRQCIQCDLIYLTPRPKRDDLPLTYPDIYEQYADKMSSVSLKKIIQALRTHLIIMPRMRHILRYVEKKKALKVLEIGCGNGHALWAIQKLVPDCEAHGVDFGDAQKDFLERRNIHFHQGAFESLDLSGSSFDIIIMSHVIEHFFNPFDVMEKIWRLSSPNGVVYIETHIADCLEQKIFGPYWIGFDAPRHLTVFNATTLKNLFVQSGYTVIMDDKRIFSIGDIIYSLRRYIFNKTHTALFHRLISDRNLILLLFSLVFNIIRKPFAASSVMRVIAHKNDQNKR